MKNYVSPLRGVQEVEERENSFKGGMKAWKNIESNGPVAASTSCFFVKNSGFGRPQ